MLFVDAVDVVVVDVVDIVVVLAVLVVDIMMHVLFYKKQWVDGCWQLWVAVMYC